MFQWENSIVLMLFQWSIFDEKNTSFFDFALRSMEKPATAMELRKKKLKFFDFALRAMRKPAIAMGTCSQIERHEFQTFRLQFIINSPISSLTYVIFLEHLNRQYI